MNDSSPSDSAADDFQVLAVARCDACGGFSYPTDVPGCRVCGAEPSHLHAEACRTPLVLKNFVTIHAPLVQGLPLPSVIGEVELAPGLVEEARIDVESESALHPGMLVEPFRAPGESPQAGGWILRPAGVVETKL